MGILSKNILLIILLFLLTSVQPIIYPTKKDGSPTSKGLEMYVKQNQFKFIKEYQDLVKDTLYDVYMSTDDLSQYTDNEDDNNLGFCFCERGSAEIIITNEEKFMAYEVSMLSKYKRRNIIESNTFVKGAIFHELTHLYFNQLILEMRMDSMFVSPEYNNFSMIPRNYFGSKFIEEGICMYVAIKIGECILGKDYKPETMEEIVDNQNKYSIKYRYSAQYVKSFLDLYGIKRGMQIFIGNKPPSFEEILYPVKFYSRLKTS